MVQEIDYFDHEADIGIIGRGDTLEDAFCAAAKAVFKIMTDITKIRPVHRVEFFFDEIDIEFALVTWINILLSKSHEYDYIFSAFELKRTDSKWIGVAYGDSWKANDTRGTEVKGATLTMLKVSKNDFWEACCVVDV